MNNLSRRNLIKVGVGFLGTGAFASALGMKLVNPEVAVAQDNMNPMQALGNLLAGNRRFIQGKTIDPNRNMGRLTEVAKGQNPFAAILSCADSRVPVEILFDQGFGDVFVVRNAGNAATPEEIGSLEFGTLVLGAKVLMVLGHERCGAVKATMQGGELPGQIGSVVAQIEGGITKFKGQHENKEAVEEAIKINVMFQMEKLKASPVISQLIKDGKLTIVGAYYDLDKGKVTTIA
jgi:carbonic anhydrase